LDAAALAYLTDTFGGTGTGPRVRPGGKPVKLSRERSGRLTLVQYQPDENGKLRRHRQKVTTVAYEQGWRPPGGDAATAHVETWTRPKESFSRSGLVRIDKARSMFTGNYGPPLVATAKTNSQRDYLRFGRALIGALPQRSLYVVGFTCSEGFVMEITGWTQGRAGACIKWLQASGIITVASHTATSRTLFAFEPDAVPASWPQANVYLLTAEVQQITADGGLLIATIAASYIVKLPFEVSKRTRSVFVAPTWRPEAAHGPPKEPEPPPTTTSTAVETLGPGLRRFLA
jgi:hypothetical protein